MLTKTLVRLFVKDPDNTGAPAVRGAYGRLAGITGLACNLLLFLIKLAAGLLSGSVAIIADAFNNLSDAGSSVVTLVSFRFAGRPADAEHPFGHGRVEYLSAMAVAVLIVLAGFELASSAFDKILHPVATQSDLLTLIILAVAILLKLWMAIFNRHIGRRIRSDTLLAAGIDSRNDVICTFLVLVSAAVDMLTGVNVDGYVGLAVALFVMWSGFTIIRDTISPLLGQKPDPALVQAIEDTVLAHKEIVGIHDMILHDYGPGRVIASLHAEVPASQDVLVSHDIIDCVENELMEKFNILSCIHMDPVDTDNPRTLQLKAMTVEVLAAIDSRLSLHDFRVVAGETHTNLLFDVLVPYDYAERDTLPARIQQAVGQQDSTLFTIAKVESDYVTK